MFQIMRSLRSWKCLTTTVGLTFTSPKANAYSPWTACSATGNAFFRVNLVQKLKIISLSWNFVHRLTQICRIPWWCSLFLFSIGNTFFVKFGPKNQNCQFELKFHTRLMWICRITFCFRPEKPFFGKYGQKNQNYQFKGKFGTKTNLNVRNSMMMLTFSVFNRKYLLGQIWSKKSKLSV